MTLALHRATISSDGSAQPWAALEFPRAPAATRFLVTFDRPMTRAEASYLGRRLRLASQMDFRASGTPPSEARRTSRIPTFLRRGRRFLRSLAGALRPWRRTGGTQLAALFAKVDTAVREPLPSAGIDPLRHIALNRGANVTLAIRHLEDAVYRSVKALTG